MHPVVLELPLGLKIYSYGVALGLAFILGWSLALRLSVREGLPYKGVSTAFMLAIIAALFGARLAHIISNPATMQMRGLFGALFASKCEGLVAYGGYIGGILAGAGYAKLRQFDLWSLLDCTSPSLVLGLGFTRIGCFFAGCCHGMKTDLPWGVVFPAGSQASRVFGDGLHPSPAVHPTQLYESLLGFLLFPLAYWLFKRRRFTGQAFLITVCCYAVGRFLLEFIRADDDRGTVGFLSTSQFIGVVLVPLALSFYFRRWKTAPAPPAPLSDEEVQARLVAAGAVKPKGGKKGKSRR